MPKVPKYELFSKFLLEQIESGVYPPDSKLPGERELAQKYDIAHMTVNKALNGLVASGYLERIPARGTFVSSRKRCRQAAVVMSYKSDPHAIFPLPLQQAMNRLGFAMTIFDTYQLLNDSGVFLNFLEQQQPEMLLIEGYSVFPMELLQSVKSNTRIAFFHRFEFSPELPYSSVITDFAQAGASAVALALENNRRKIGIITGTIDSDFHSDKAYLDGALARMAEAGLEPVIIADGLHLTEESESTLLMECDAVLSVLDSYLIPICKRARKTGVRVPEDLVLIGAKNSAWAESFDLTSYDVQSTLLVEELLHTVLNATEVRQLKIPVKFCFRHSCPAAIGGAV